MPLTADCDYVWLYGCMPKSMSADLVCGLGWMLPCLWRTALLRWHIRLTVLYMCWIGIFINDVNFDRFCLQARRKARNFWYSTLCICAANKRQHFSSRSSR